MKTKLILALLALATFSLVGCSEKEVRNGPFPIYQIAIELLDQQGNNISEVAGANTTGEVFDSKSYKLDPSYSSTVAEDNIRYFILRADAGGPGYGSTALIWKLKCKEVFGDEEIRTVESKWESSDTDNKYKRCLSFEFAGKSYTTELKNGLWTARVVVNR